MISCSLFRPMIASSSDGNKIPQPILSPCLRNFAAKYQRLVGEELFKRKISLFYHRLLAKNVDNPV